jgi:hypothetical protein
MSKDNNEEVIEPIKEEVIEPISGPVKVTAMEPVKGPSKKLVKSTTQIPPELLEEIKEKVRVSLEKCTSKREVLDVEIDSLAECVALASEIYKNNPNLDNAYQLSSLTSAHNAALGQLEKMKNPIALLAEIEGLMRRALMDIVRSLALEIEKAKVDLTTAYPDGKSTINEIFSRMLDSVQPQTSSIYEDMHKSLKSILGIKS